MLAIVVANNKLLITTIHTTTVTHNHTYRHTNNTYNHSYTQLHTQLQPHATTHATTASHKHTNTHTHSHSHKQQHILPQPHTTTHTATSTNLVILRSENAIILELFFSKMVTICLKLPGTASKTLWNSPSPCNRSPMRSRRFLSTSPVLSFKQASATAIRGVSIHI